MKLTRTWTLACAIVVAASAHAQEKIWLGEYRIDGKPTAVILHDRSASDAGKSDIDLPGMGARGVPLKRMEAQAGRMRFEMQGGPDLFRFDGKQDGAGVNGTVTKGGRSGTFTLVQTDPADTAEARRMAGSFQVAPGHIIDIGPMDEMGGQPVFIDHKTLREGPLYRLGDGSYASGPTLGIPYPFRLRAQPVRAPDGTISAIRWNDGKRTRLAKRVAPHRVEDVTVKNGDVTLKGTLLVPAAPGPHPAIVLAHGSGDTTRNVGMWNVYFVRLGFAVLSLDKRGAGQSSGDWTRSDMHDIASDWLAGVAMLRQRADIDPKRIGVHGSSQGGWTAPLMAVRSPDVAFVIVRAGSALNVADTMAYEVGWSVREAGLSAADAAEARAAVLKLFQLSGASWDDFSAAADGFKQKRWAAHAWPVHMSKDGWGRGWVARNAGYDPAATLAQVRVPVLWYLGDLDHNVPSAATAERLEQARRAAHHPDFTVVTLRNAGHGFTHTTTGNNSEFARQTHMAAGYWDSMQAWLAKRGFSK